MKARVLTSLLIFLTIILASYSLRLISLDSSWFERSLPISYLSYYLSFVFPFLSVFLFFQKFVKIISFITTLILFLCLLYGFSYIGSVQMLSTYLKFTICFIVSIIVLISIIAMQNRKDSKNII